LYHEKAIVMSTLRLTQFSPGAGCGCKISPADLKEILKDNTGTPVFPGLLIGYETSDDAAVFDIGDGKALISTTDFFTPIVDDPFDFGRIAAANAISDIYAMGGLPVMALSVLGWPLEKLSAETAGHVIKGAREICSEAGIPLAGGHSIDISDPVFGLVVTGMAEISSIRANNTARAGCRLLLSKPLGIGILSTAGKKGVLTPEDYQTATGWMTKLNHIGTDLGKIRDVKAMTDITGFGLLGHLLEMCEGSRLSAVIKASAVPLLDNLDYYLEKKCIPGGTYRNWKSYGHKIGGIREDTKLLFADPQTSGGLLIAADPCPGEQFMALCKEHHLVEIGYLKEFAAESPVIAIE
jgi:selenide,water dikinase